MRVFSKWADKILVRSELIGSESKSFENWYMLNLRSLHWRRKLCRLDPIIKLNKFETGIEEQMRALRHVKPFIELVKHVEWLLFGPVTNLFLLLLQLLGLAV